MPNSDVDSIIFQIETLLKDLKKAIQNPQAEASVQTQSVTRPTPPAPAKTIGPPPPITSLGQFNSDDLGDFESLKKALESNKWPEAVNSNLICDPNNEEHKLGRGRGIVELMIEEDLKGLKFLDYGCGEGHCAFVATEWAPQLSVGYDPIPRDTWDNFNGQTKDNLLLTSNFEIVKQNGPYDVIVLFDVLDHAQGQSPDELLKMASSVLSNSGKIYLRTHPYTSRHATHLYHDINKAFLHLVFTPQELQQLVPDSKHYEANVGITFPLKSYAQMIAAAGLKEHSRRESTEGVEPFFKIPKIAERIMRATKSDKFPEFQMGLSFIDYCLKK